MLSAYQVLDLDPTDGIAAAVSFANGAYVETYATPDNDITRDYHSDAGAVGAILSVSSLLGWNSASAGTTAGDPVGTGAGPGGAAFASVAGANSYARGVAYSLLSSFTLSPHTELVFTASTSDVSATGTELGDTAYALSGVELCTLPDCSSGPSSQGTSYVGVFSDGTTYSSLSPSVTASFFNFTNTAMTGTAYAGAYVFATGVATVPEPESWALLVAGLAVLGAVVRRRQFG